MMKTARVRAFTERPEDIRLEEVPVPEPAHGQVRVRMLMCPVHPSDFHYVRGTYYQALERIIWNQGRSAADPRVCFDPGRGSECPVPPYSLGQEGVGIVDASGGGFLARRLAGRRVAVSGGGPAGNPAPPATTLTRTAGGSAMSTAGTRARPCTPPVRRSPRSVGSSAASTRISSVWRSNTARVSRAAAARDGPRSDRCRRCGAPADARRRAGRS